IDCEVRLAEPPAMWERYLEQPFRSQTRVEQLPSRPLAPSTRFELAGRAAGDTPEFSRLTERKSSRIGSEHPNLVEARARPRPETYLQGMDAEGINIAILAPSVTFKMVSQDDLDPRHALALCRAYNGYAADFSA